MNSCPNNDYLERFCECRLDESENSEIESHLESCSRCREQLEKLEKRIADKGFSFLLFDQDGSRSLDQSRSQAAPDPGEALPAGRTPGLIDAPGNPRIGRNGELVIPERIGLYRIGKKIGSGGMGDVYEAEHTYLKRPVAIKFIRSAQITPRFVERFEREMTAAGKLSHPNVVATFDAGEWAGIPFLVMERLEGMSLKDYVEKFGAQSVKSAARMAAQAALGLQFAHEAGIIHHDVKPANLWITLDGTVKVLDLGLAHFKSDALRNSEEAAGQAPDQQDRIALETSGLGEVETNNSRTATPAQGGTPDYMAPEQFSTVRELDERSDVYSLGCTLYYLLTGSAPFPTDRYPTFKAKKEAHLFQSVPAIKSLSDRSGKAIQNLIAIMTDKRPDFRVQSMAAVAERLEPFYRPRASKFALAAGYILPFALGVPGLLVAIYNYRSGSTGHGIGQIVLSCLILALVLFASVGYWLNRENINSWMATNRIISEYFSGDEGEKGQEGDEPTQQSVNQTDDSKTPEQEQQDFQASLEKAESGDADAQLDVAVRYLQGRGVKKDPVKAIPWFEKSALQDNVAAQHNLGILYFTGEGVLPDRNKSFQWSLRAANQGLPEAQCRVALSYAYGLGVEQDSNKMFSWLQKAARGDCLQAKYFLAKCYQTGDGVEKDEQKAIRWMSEASEQEYTEAQADYGLYLLTGYGGKKNMQEGLLLLIKAQRKGSVQARAILERLKYMEDQNKPDLSEEPLTDQQKKRLTERIADLDVPGSGSADNNQANVERTSASNSDSASDKPAPGDSNRLTSDSSSGNQNADANAPELSESPDLPDSPDLPKTSESAPQPPSPPVPGEFNPDKYKRDRFSCLLPKAEQEYFDKKYTKLHLLAAAEKTDRIEDYLKVYPEDLNAQEEDGATPLYSAVLVGNKEIVDILCDHGANVNLSTTKLISPLLSSISHRNFPIFQKLLESGADPNQPGEAGLTPLHVAVFFRSESMVRALIKKGANLEAKDQQLGLTPLAAAVMEKNVSMAKLLIDSGAKKDCKSAQGDTLSDIALKNGDRKMLELLK